MTDPVAVEYPRWRQALNSIWWPIRNAWRRYVPVLIWRGQEVDVRIIFREAALPGDATIEGALEYLEYGVLADLERKLGEIGIEFDHGGGCGGRDWEFDWSRDVPPYNDAPLFAAGVGQASAVKILRP